MRNQREPRQTRGEHANSNDWRKQSWILGHTDTQSRKESTVKGVKENICIYRSDLKGIKCWQLILVNCQTNIQLCGSNVHSLYCIYSFYFCSFFNVLHFSFYISFPGVFTLFLYFGTKVHTNNTYYNYSILIYSIVQYSICIVIV